MSYGSDYSNPIYSTQLNRSIVVSNRNILNDNDNFYPNQDYSYQTVPEEDFNSSSSRSNFNPIQTNSVYFKPRQFITDRSVPSYIPQTQRIMPMPVQMHQTFHTPQPPPPQLQQQPIVISPSFIPQNSVTSTQNNAYYHHLQSLNNPSPFIHYHKPLDQGRAPAQIITYPSDPTQMGKSYQAPFYVSPTFAHQQRSLNNNVIIEQRSNAPFFHYKNQSRVIPVAPQVNKIVLGSKYLSYEPK